ncbi:phosphoribosylanthranilate isomerase [Chryseobacterium daeguense]|uniref:phosphoribosylanthranilate isomerase n=1 Tax=Chryseobacterium daeguense TaxID=412438 RepID=UPI00041C6B16|nr:phosphoribosylanthranilate isomerase [Chryseobacterium daeguense]
MNLQKPKLKVCGLTKTSQINELASINIDFLGFIFYKKSPRYVLDQLSLEEISEINHHGKVGVFVNENINKIVEISEKANLNYIQLHGDENENFIFELKKEIPDIKIIKAIRIANNEIKINDKITENTDYFLFDTDSKAFGGTGKQFDWNILNTVQLPLPYFLSGGISEENIDQVKILNQKPFAIDINSKFETEPGIKNISKIKTFKELY